MRLRFLNRVRVIKPMGSIRADPSLVGLAEAKVLAWDTAADGFSSFQTKKG